MSLSVSPIRSISFTQSTAKSAKTKTAVTDDKNPISKWGERANLVKATFVAGAGIGLRLLAEIWDSDFVFNHIEKQSKKMVKKSGSDTAKFMRGLGACVALLGAAVAAFAALYTIFSAPKIAYKGKVNAFTKGKDMDVYIKGNKAEKELFSQIAEKSKDATDEEKDELAKQYLMMKVAKNKVPDFIKK